MWNIFGKIPQLMQLERSKNRKPENPNRKFENPTRPEPEIFRIVKTRPEPKPEIKTRGEPKRIFSIETRRRPEHYLNIVERRYASIEAKIQKFEAGSYQMWLVGSTY